MRMLHQLASGLLYIHDKNFLHLDVKPDNVLISQPVHAEDPQSVQIKLGDLGHCERAVNGSAQVGRTTGEKTYLAPEVANELSRLEDNRSITVTKASDIFAIGCVFFNIIDRERHHPFGNDETERLFNIKTHNAINLKGMV